MSLEDKRAACSSALDRLRSSVAMSSVFDEWFWRALYVALSLPPNNHLNLFMVQEKTNLECGQAREY